MPDDRKGRTIAALEDFRRVASRPPGVPRTVTESDLGAQAAAAIRALFATFTLDAPRITTGTDDRIVDVDVSVRLTAREVRMMAEWARATEGWRKSWLAEGHEVTALWPLLTSEWKEKAALDVAAGFDTGRALAYLFRNGHAMRVGSTWRRTP